MSTVPAEPALFSGEAPVNPAPRLHLDYLDGLRALAALFVLLHHGYISVWNIFAQRYPSGLLDRLTHWMIYGHFAVSVFIVISGFSLMLPLVRGDGALKGGPTAFFKRRARRILPPYYCAMGLSLLVWLFLFSHDWRHPGLPFSLADILSHLFLVHNFSRATMGTINGTFWSIAVESQIYLVFPLLVWLWKRIGPEATLLLTILVGYGGRWLLETRYPDQIGLTAHYLTLFCMGMFGTTVAFSPAENWRRMREGKFWPWLAMGLFVWLIALCTYWGWDKALGARQHHTDFLVGLCAMCLLILASRSTSNLPRKALSLRPLPFLGSFAYSIYLSQLPLLLIYRKFLMQPGQMSENAMFALFLLLGFPLLIGGAYLFFLACERPFLNAPSVRRDRNPV